MGSAYVLADNELRNKLYAEPRLRGDIKILEDRIFDNDGTHLLWVISDQLPAGRNGMRAIVVDGDCARFQPDIDT